MNLLTNAYQDRVCFLTDFIKNLISVNENQLSIVNKLEGVVIYVDKFPSIHGINTNCTAEWSDLKNYYLTSQRSSEMPVCFIPSATKAYLQPFHYSSGTKIASLFDDDVWRELYDITGTSLMKFILFDSTLYIPLNDSNSYLALHSERASRVLNNLAKSSNIFKFKNVEGNKSVGSSCVTVKKNICCDLVTKASFFPLMPNDKCSINGNYGFNGLLSLNLCGLMYRTKAVDNKFIMKTCADNCYDDIDELRKHLKQAILLQDVGVNMEYKDIDLAGFEKMLKAFISKNCADANHRKLVYTILKMDCCKSQEIICNKKRKLPSDDRSAVKKLRESENTTVIKNMKKGNRRLHSGTKNINSKLNSLNPVSIFTVKSFLKIILRKVLPRNAFGKQSEFVIKQLLKFLKYGKGQSFELRDLLSGINISNIPFLQSVKCDKMKLNLLAKFLLWLLYSYIFAVLSKTYYITESKNSFNKLNYYKRREWLALKYCIINNLIKSGRLKVLKKKLLMYQNMMGAKSCRIRFIPKGKFSARPIVWSSFKNKYVEFCQIYLGQLCLFNKESRKLSDLNELHKVWLSFREKQKMSGNSSYFFVKLDISDAYGSVRLKNLLSIVKRLVQKTHLHKCDKTDSGIVKRKLLKEITLRKLKCFKKRNGSISCRYIYRFDELPCNAPSNSIIIPTGDVKVIKMRHLVNVIQREILFKDVTVGRNRYLILKGIPQGGPLSSVLCQLYYDCLDNTHLKKFTDQEEDFFVRAVDDYLYVTPNLDRAQKFLSVMEGGFDDFYCYINKMKTVTNFGSNSKNVISFYGLKIDTKTMNLSGNYDAYKGINIFHTFSFKSRANPGLFLKNRMILISSLKLHDILLNTVINNEITVLLNVMRASLLMAFRFHAVVLNMFKSYNPAFLTSCIFMFGRIVANRVNLVNSKYNLQGKKTVNDEMVLWTVYKSFLMRLDREKAVIKAYEIILDHLKKMLMIIFGKLSEENQELLRTVSKYEVKNDFKGTR